MKTKKSGTGAAPGPLCAACASRSSLDRARYAPGNAEAPEPTGSLPAETLTVLANEYLDAYGELRDLDPDRLRH